MGGIPTKKKVGGSRRSTRGSRRGLPPKRGEVVVEYEPELRSAESRLSLVRVESKGSCGFASLPHLPSSALVYGLSPPNNLDDANASSNSKLIHEIRRKEAFIVLQQQAMWASAHQALHIPKKSQFPLGSDDSLKDDQEDNYNPSSSGGGAEALVSVATAFFDSDGKLEKARASSYALEIALKLEARRMVRTVIKRGIELKLEATKLAQSFVFGVGGG
jgi:hypothetical protein